MKETHFVNRIKTSLKSSSFRIMLLAGIVMAFTFCVAGPLELYFGNRHEFWFELSDLYFYIFVLFLSVVFMCFVVGSLLGERGRTLFACLFWGISMALYLQANFLNGAMGLLDGREIDWCASPAQVILNSIVWIACILFPILLRRFLKSIWTEVIVVLSLVVFAMQFASFVSLGISVPKNTGEVQLTTDDMFQLSKDKNVIVFVLDTMDAQFFEKYVISDPEYMELFKDFTYFDNAVSGGGPTVYGMPMLLTGTYYEGEKYEEYLSAAYAHTNLYEKLQKHNYDVRLYTTDQFVSDAFFTKYINNANSVQLTISSKSGLLKKLYQFVGYRQFPMIIKNQFYLYSGEFDQFKTSNTVTPYTVDDADFIRRFREDGISLQEDKNAFKLYHLFGAHPPYTLDENGYLHDNGTSQAQQIEGVFKVVRDYIHAMKEQDLYDKSTILIVADHGAVDIYQNPMLLIKSENHTQDQLEIRHAPVSFKNILPTLSSAIDGINDEQERSLFEIDEEEQVTRYQVASPALVKQYYQQGDWDYPVRFSVGNPARNTDMLQEIGSVEPKRDRVYKLGETLLFTNDGDGIKTLYEGFSIQEDNGIWTDASRALQKLQFATFPKKNIEVNIELESVFAPPQQVTIYFNNVCVYSQMQTENQISFVVPKEAISETVQELVYQLSTTAPCEINSSTDTRALSIKLKSIQVKETNKEVEQVVPINFYMIGDEIHFTDEKDGTKYFTSGISSIETDSVWSSGKAGQIVLNIGDFTGDLSGTFHFQSVYKAPQKLIIRSAGQTLYDAVITSVDAPVKFTVPAECINNDQLVLDLEYPDAISPASHSQSTDDRELAFRFSSIRFFEGEV